MKRNHLTEIIAALFILLFVYTATSKFLEFTRFQSVLSRSPLIGRNASALAWILPLTELVIALTLFLPQTRRYGLWASLGIMVLFTGYIGYMITFTPNLPCSCGGVIKYMTWTQHFVFNIFFTLLALVAIWLERRQSKLYTRFAYSTTV